MYTIDILRILNELDVKPIGKTTDYFAELFSVSVPTINNMIRNYNDVLPMLAEGSTSW